ncbi:MULTISPECIES: LysE family translocator [Mammaliicoccus]|uniref:LysE family translocator n=1 Tax=Mammaliicoccus sciuri TaxID=1296 RepID=A0AAI8GSR0_MAMSC|nr:MULTISPECIES: LysE family translocator [Mammaliicoccus]ASE33206.1 LysE family translocator [Mammaliicoccus sciuri]KTT79321.1 homoserine lactone transporter [Mammaliicoccus sciuri]KTT79625.1 homoserine lactone transporter [Mammaliicoccus sciuri]KTT90556.1 homoserine lactone transporter [Mammaliicoccus sciuri]KTT92001.1 homoserine lactone transporter [Mammaliicoccus sciuri]
MFDIVSFQLFLITVLIICITPGIDMMFILNRSISQGRDAGIYSALGVSVGAVVHTILSGLGLSVILQTSVVLFTIIKVVGAVYLIYLGIQMFISKQSSISIKKTVYQSRRKLFVQGVITNVTNPKVALFFISFIPQFISVDNQYGPIPFLILGSIFAVMGAITSFIIAIFSSSLTTKLRDNIVAEKIINKISGAVFVILGISLFGTKS